MNLQFNVAIVHIAGKLHPRGWSVGGSAERGRFVVPDDLPLGQFGDQGVAEAFEAWRMWAHERYGLPYDTTGEIQAACVMAKQLVELYGPTEETATWIGLLFAEIVGQSLYEKVHGDFPALPAQFVDKAVGRYMGAARRFTRLAHGFSSRDTLAYGLAWAARELVSEAELEGTL